MSPKSRDEANSSVEAFARADSSIVLRSVPGGSVLGSSKAALAAEGVLVRDLDVQRLGATGGGVHAEVR